LPRRAEYVSRQRGGATPPRVRRGTAPQRPCPDLRRTAQIRNRDRPGDVGSDADVTSRVEGQRPLGDDLAAMSGERIAGALVTNSSKRSFTPKINAMRFPDGSAKIAVAQQVARCHARGGRHRRASARVATSGLGAVVGFGRSRVVRSRRSSGVDRVVVASRRLRSCRQRRPDHAVRRWSRGGVNLARGGVSDDVRLPMPRRCPL
jgi:hypothetical protein